MSPTAGPPDVAHSLLLPSPAIDSPAATPRGTRDLPLLLTLAAVQFTHIVDFMIMMPLGPQFMRLFGIGPQQFGFLVSAYTLAAAASGFVAALWIDRFDRRRALLGLYGGFVIATADGGFRPVRLAPAGRRAMPAEDFVHGHRPQLGEQLG